jgi:hypothetical protein
VERFHQTQKKWLAAQPAAESLVQLQRLLDAFRRGRTARSTAAPPTGPRRPAQSPPRRTADPAALPGPPRPRRHRRHGHRPPRQPTAPHRPGPRTPRRARPGPDRRPAACASSTPRPDSFCATSSSTRPRTTSRSADHPDPADTSTPRRPQAGQDWPQATRRARP